MIAFFLKRKAGFLNLAFKALILSSFFFHLNFLQATGLNNVKGLYGERATGFAGAFTALSDDPSGAYYNPAGLSFATHNYISVTASSYNQTEKVYSNIVGLWQDYKRESNTYNPNFIGALKLFDNWAFAFTIVNTISEDYNQGDQFRDPGYFPDFSEMRADYSENAFQFLFGPSISIKISKNSAIGFTLYGFNDRRRRNIYGEVSVKDGTYGIVSINDNRVTNGMEPIFGIQTQLLNNMSLGLSVKKKFATDKNRRYSSRSILGKDHFFIEATDTQSSVTAGGNLIRSYDPVSKPYAFSGDSNFTGSIPEPIETRFGIAFFPDRFLTLSTDIIHTSSYSKKKKYYLSDYKNNIVYLYDYEQKEVRQKETINFAFGMEYFFLDNLALRVGYFTNRSVVKKFKVYDYLVSTFSLVDSSARLNYSLNDRGGLIYNLPSSPNTSPSQDWMNTEGYTLALSFDTGQASTSLSFVHEEGKGKGQIELLRELPPLNSRLKSWTIILAATIKY